jgi:kynurenine formamidase
MQILDLSHTITADMPVWPGTPRPEFSPLATIPVDGFAEQSICISSHTGTHLDFPAHIIEGGLSLDRFEAGRFFGRGVVIDASLAAGKPLSLELLQPYAGAVAQCDFVLFRTGWARFWGQERYSQGYPVLDCASASWLAGFALKGVGLDCPSFDHADSTDYPIHRTLLEAGVFLVENMTNLHLLPASFFLSVFPLRIAGAEASPVRAVAYLSTGDSVF